MENRKKNKSIFFNHRELIRLVHKKHAGKKIIKMTAFLYGASEHNMATIWNTTIKKSRMCENFIFLLVYLMDQ